MSIPPSSPAPRRRRYGQPMVTAPRAPFRPRLAAAAALGALCAALPAGTAGAQARADARAQAAGDPAVSAAAAPSTHALLTSRSLWSTIDVCNPSDQRDTVGVRGSMPGDGHARDRMYMAFRLQYLNSGGVWVDLAGSSPRHYVFVGAAASARQSGRSFQLMPVAGRPAATLRGVVDFQWRRGQRVLLSVSRPTSAGHVSVAGADPAGFSAARCVIG
jgi:hypothetical protein